MQLITLHTMWKKHPENQKKPLFELLGSLTTNNSKHRNPKVNLSNDKEALKQTLFQVTEKGQRIKFCLQESSTNKTFKETGLKRAIYRSSGSLL